MVVQPTIEEESQRDYEMVLVIKPGLTEEALGTAVDNVTRFVTERGGTITEVNHWGRRKLAYPIKHFAEGSYVLTKLKMKPELHKALEANLRISEDVIRHLLIRVDS